MIPKIYERLQEIASNLKKKFGGDPQIPAGARAFGARFGVSPSYHPHFQNSWIRPWLPMCAVSVRQSARLSVSLSVCQSVCLSVCQSVSRHETRLHCAGSFGAAFAKSRWFLVKAKRSS